MASKNFRTSKVFFDFRRSFRRSDFRRSDQVDDFDVMIIFHFCHFRRSDQFNKYFRRSDQSIYFWIFDVLFLIFDEVIFDVLIIPQINHSDTFKVVVSVILKDFKNNLKPKPIAGHFWCYCKFIVNLGDFNFYLFQTVSGQTIPTICGQNTRQHTEFQPYHSSQKTTKN